MMLAVMYGMIPSAKIEKLSNAPPGEQVQEPECTLLVGRVPELLDGDGVDTGHPDEHAQPVDGNHGNDEQDLVSKVVDLEDVRQAFDHADGPFVDRVVVSMMS